MHALLDWGTSHGYLGLFAILSVGVFLPLPEDTTLLFAGYLVSRGQLALAPTWLAAILGCLTGITLSYSIGRSAGLILVSRLGHALGMTPHRLQRTTEWFHRVGKWGLLLGYFVPGVRHLMAFVAGSSKMTFPVFIIFAGSGSILASSLFLALGFVLGGKWKPFAAAFNQHHFATCIGMALLIATGFLWQWGRSRKGTHALGLKVPPASG